LFNTPNGINIKDMAKLNYIVTSASNTFSGGVCDTDMYFPFAGDKKLDKTWGYITEDEFEAMDDLEYLGFDGDYYVYADGKGKKFFTETRVGRGLASAGKGIVSAAKWVASTLWGQRMKDRRTKRRNRKSEKQVEKEKKAKEKAEKQGLPPKEVQKVVEAEGQKVKQQEEAAISNAETTALNAAKNAGKTIEEIEKAANDAGEQLEKQIYGGYLAGEDKNFWKSMGVGGKVAIIGGGALFIGLIIYLVVKKK
jgi:hypothetical protein